jgi:hypothetical protein
MKRGFQYFFFEYHKFPQNNQIKFSPSLTSCGEESDNDEEFNMDSLESDFTTSLVSNWSTQTVGKGQESDRSFTASPIRFMSIPTRTPIHLLQPPTQEVVGVSDAYLGDAEDSSDEEGDSTDSSIDYEV